MPRQALSPPSKGKSRLIPIAVAAVVCVLVLAVAVPKALAMFGGSGTQAQVEEQPATGSATGAATESAQEADKLAYEDFTIKDVKYETDASGQPMLTCTFTNNTDKIAEYVYFDITGSFMAKDNYGEESNSDADLKLYCQNCPTYNGVKANEASYLMPGDTKLEFIPVDQNNIVYTYGTSGSDDEMKVGLSDFTNFTIDASCSNWADVSQCAVIDEDEYELEPALNIQQNSNPYITAKITNESSEYWSNATIYVKLLDGNGNRATNSANASADNQYAFIMLSCSYLAPGASSDQLAENASKGLTTNISKNLNVGNFEIQRVVVQKDLSKTSSATSATSASSAAAATAASTTDVK